VFDPQISLDGAGPGPAHQQGRHHSGPRYARRG
jgi:hypothetical protein